MTDSTAADGYLITPEFVAGLLRQQGLAFGEDDLQHITRHYVLLSQHARLVMDMVLDEYVEPAPLFLP